MRFKYKAHSVDGKVIKSEAEAVDRFALARRLKKEDKTVVSIKPIKEKSGKFEQAQLWFATLSRPSVDERMMFVRNLSAMLEAGLPLTRSLGVLERQVSNPRFKKVIRSLVKSITAGGAFSDAAAKFPRVFSPLTLAMIKAGEASGTLPASLNVVADHLEKSSLLAKRIRSAMIYPAIIIVAIMIVGVLMFFFVVPTLTATFKELGVELPLSTKLIIDSSEFLRANTILSFILLIAVIGSLYALVRAPSGKRAFELILLRIPVLSGIVREINSARTTRTLSSLLQSGVAIVDALSITADVVQNSRFRVVLQEAKKRISKGEPLSKVFSEHEDVYPILVSEMTAVGEETGKLPDLLMRLAHFYEARVERSTRDLSSVIEPAIMVLVGAAVGFFAFSMITPLYSVLGGI